MIQVWVWWLIWLNCHSSMALSIRTRKIVISDNGQNLAALKEDNAILDGLTARKRRNADNGVLRPSYCKFPFIYKNVSYTECTTADDPNGQQWCSTQTNDTIHMQGNWRHCRDFEGITVSSSPILNEDVSGRSYGLNLLEDDGKLCGVSVNRLLAGRSLLDDFVVQEHKNLAKEGEYPWQVAILSRNLEYMCGGVIVCKRHIITVAHCVVDISAGDIVVRVGDFDLSSDDEEYPSYDIAVRWIKVHPDFIEAKLRDDLAILEVKFNLYRLANVAPACLPTPESLSDVEDCKVPGWGQFETSVADMGSHTFSYKMMVAGFHTISRNVCQTTLRATRKVGAFFKLQKGNICAVGNEGGDACHGDGGSGLICPNNLNQFVVEGLVSWGLGCGLGHPGAYVDVRHYLDWIIEEKDSPGPQPVATYQAPTSSTEPVATYQASTHTPRPIATYQALTRTPRPAATYQASSRSTEPVATSEYVPQITSTRVDAGSEYSITLSNLPLQPPSEVVNFNHRPKNVNLQVPVQPTLLSYFTASTEVELTDSTLEVSISASTATVTLVSVTPDSNIGFIPPAPVGPTTTLGTFEVFTPSATVVNSISISIVEPVETISTFVQGLPIPSDSIVHFVPPKPDVPSLTTDQQFTSNLPLFGHLPDSFGQLPSSPGTEHLNNIPPPPSPNPGTNNGPHQVFNPFSPNQGFGVDPFSHNQGFGFDPFSPGSGTNHGSLGTGAGTFPPGPDSYYGPPGTGAGTFPHGPGGGIQPPGTGAGTFPPGPDSYYGPPGTGAGTFPHGPGGGIQPPGTGAGTYPPGPDSYYGPPGTGIFPPGPDSSYGPPGTGIFPPGPDSSYGTPGTGAGTFPPGPDSLYGPPGTGIFPPGQDSSYGPPGTGAGTFPPGPDSSYGPPGTRAGTFPPGPDSLYGPPGTGIFPPGPDSSYGPPGTGAGTFPPGPDSSYGSPGTRAGTFPPGPGVGILPPGTGAGTFIPGTGAGTFPPGPDSYYGPPGTFPPGPGGGIQPPGTGAGTYPPGPDSYYGPPGSGTGAGIRTPGQGAGILPPPDNYYGPPG